MNFRIADTFTGSLGRLNNEEQKAVKTTAFDLQLNPANPGLKFHKLDRAKDKRFWSVRVNADIRLIVHRTETSLLLCYVGHHDDAYRWAGKRRIEQHPRTGAAQIVEVRETVREIEVPRYVEAEPHAAPRLHEDALPSRPRLFEGVSQDDLLSYGVPEEWMEDVLGATEDTLFDLTDHLPREAAEALLELATGSRPVRPVVAAPEADPFEHPDARRRFRVVADSDELRRALEYPWEKWTVFLHPAQRDLVERRYEGPARVAGSAGTGKTVVALHRAALLARRNPDSRVLLTTFSNMLARALRVKLRRLLGDDPDIEQRIAVRAIDEVGIEIYEKEYGAARIPTPAMLRALIRAASEEAGEHRFTLRFLESEWADVVDAWQLESWEAYRDVARLGRKTRLGEKQRAKLWEIFGGVREALEERGLVTISTIFARAADIVQEAERSPFDSAVIDEAQDIGVPHLRFLVALGGERPEALFFAGDLGQRIFQTPFSWKSLGVDVRGRSHTLRINYRTSHQIRLQADRLLPEEMADVDGVEESRRGTVSAFNGPDPVVRTFMSVEEETEAIARWIKDRVAEQIPPHEIGVFVRSEAELERARAAMRQANIPWVELDGQNDQPDGSAALSTMHMAKGLEFRAVVVAACDDEIIPLQSRIESIGDEADLEDAYNTERHLLYVACTRARDYLLVTGVDPASEFLDDLQGEGMEA